VCSRPHGAQVGRERDSRHGSSSEQLARRLKEEALMNTWFAILTVALFLGIELALWSLGA
jgi:hypothetical protein